MNKFIAPFLGGFFGIIVFSVVMTLLIGTPFGDWFESAHGVMSDTDKAEISEEEKALLWRMLNNGSLVSTEGVISTISTVYGTLIQVLVGVIAVSGVLSFFAIRWQSELKTEEYVSERIDKKFKSSEFNSRMNSAIANWLDINPPEGSEELLERMIRLEDAIANLQSEEEPAEAQSRKKTKPKA